MFPSMLSVRLNFKGLHVQQFIGHAKLQTLAIDY